MESVIAWVIAALFLVESSDGKLAHRYRDNGKAVGPFSIWPCTVKECNRIAGYKKYTLEDRKDFVASYNMVKETLEFHYARGTTNPIALGGKWRNPFSECPKWYLLKVEKALEVKRYMLKEVSTMGVNEK